MNLFFSWLGVCCQCAGPGVPGVVVRWQPSWRRPPFSLKNPPTLLWPPYPVTSVISGIPGRIKVPVVRVYCGSEIPTVPYRSRYRGTTVGIHSSVGISSHLVARYEDTFLYLLSSSAPIVRAQDKGAKFLALPPGGAWSGGPGVGARCGNGLFPLINLPNFILASLS